MDLDLDPLGDILHEQASTHVRAGGKFQPRARPGPRKVVSAPVPSMFPSNAQEKAVTPSSTSLETSQSVQPVDIAADSFTSLISSSSVSSGAEEPLKNNDEGDMKCERVNPVKKGMNAIDLNDSISDVNDDRNLSIVESAGEAGSMGFDLDPPDNILSEPHTINLRAGSKFQPRAKVPPRKGPSVAVASAVPNTIVERPPSPSESVQFAKSVDDGNDRQTNSVSSSLVSFDSFGIKESSRNIDYSCAAVQLGATDAEHSGLIVSDPYSRLGNSIGENADIFSCLATNQEFFRESTNIIEIPAPASNEDTDGKSIFPVENSVNCSGFRLADVVNLEDPVPSKEAAVQIDNGRLESEFQESGSYAVKNPDILSGANIASGCCTRKFQPIPREQTDKEKRSTSMVAPDAFDSSASPQNPQFAPSETICTDEGSIPAFPSDDVLDYPSTGVGDFVPLHPSTSEFQLNEEQVDFAEVVLADDATFGHSEDVLGVPEMKSSTSRKRNTSASHHSQKLKKSSSAGDNNEGGKSSRQLRKRASAPKYVDEPDNEAHENGGFPAAPANGYVVDEEESDYEYNVDKDIDHGVGRTRHNKGASKKSKKPLAEKEKLVRKRKGAKDAPEKSKQEPPKKFSHSTRRKKRCVNKDLLNMPEDELDFQKLPIRDIILLAEHRERVIIKEAKMSKTPSTNQRADLHGEESRNDEDTMASEQDGGYTGDKTNYMAQSDLPLFNHNSFMDRTPTARWSKQDTELFYEGIQQFGCDLSMIQQLFPGLTRHQVKLKWKNEERKHPLRLNEAVKNRAKDHSYFERVIEQLQQVASQAEQESSRDETVNLTDDVDMGLNPKTNEEVTKSEGGEDVAIKDQEPDVAEVHSPMKSDESDGDVDLWSSYKSEF